MSAHAFFAPSKGQQWINCPGSMAFPQNQVDGGSSTFADDGTASHWWAAESIKHRVDAISYLGQVQVLNGKPYTMDEERAAFVQAYIDDVYRRAIGGELYNDMRVDLSHILGEDQGGTLDNAAYLPADEHLIGIDLKYGTGEKVYAKYLRPGTVDQYDINPQLGLYLLGLLDNMMLLDKPVKKVTAVIHQPRLYHVDEHTISVEELLDFAEKAALAVRHAGNAMILPLNSPEFLSYLSPGDKTCRWCNAKAVCPKLQAFVAEQVACDFDTIAADPLPEAPKDTTKLSKAYAAVPLVELWCTAVRAETWKLVAEGVPVLGSDGQPMKFVEGKGGKRVWNDLTEAEAALLGVLPPEKAYEPQKVITAPAADKLLNKKATKQTWKDVFEPLIVRQKSSPALALGSDERPPFKGAATGDDFDNVEAPE